MHLSIYNLLRKNFCKIKIIFPKQNLFKILIFFSDDINSIYNVISQGKAIIMLK